MRGRGFAVICGIWVVFRTSMEGSGSIRPIRNYVFTGCFGNVWSSGARTSLTDNRQAKHDHNSPERKSNLPASELPSQASSYVGYGQSFLLIVPRGSRMGIESWCTAGVLTTQMAPVGRCLRGTTARETSGIAAKCSSKSYPTYKFPQRQCELVPTTVIQTRSLSKFIALSSQTISSNGIAYMGVQNFAFLGAILCVWAQNLILVPYPIDLEHLIQIRPQVFQLSCSQTDRRTDSNDFITLAVIEDNKHLAYYGRTATECTSNYLWNINAGCAYRRRSPSKLTDA